MSRPTTPSHASSSRFVNMPSPVPPTTSTIGPSHQPRRAIYYGIKRGRVPGVYTSEEQAEEQVIVSLSGFVYVGKEWRDETQGGNKLCCQMFPNHRP
jgi:hypothetical protein